MPAPVSGPRGLRSPPSLRAEHVALHKELKQVMRLPGAVGAAAHRVAQVLHRHFLAEEQWVLPLLTALPWLAEGHLPAQADAVIEAADQLPRELARMLDEHAELARELDHLAVAAEQEGMTSEVNFARRVKDHARLEDEVLYPAAVVAGRYIRLLREVARDS